MTQYGSTMRAWCVRITLTCLVLLFAAMPSAWADIWSEVREADRQIEAWNYPAAKASVSALRASEPQHPGVLYVSGKLRYHLGDYDTAVQELETAVKNAPSRSMHAMRELIDRVRGTRDLVSHYERYVSPNGHFEIRHEARDAMLMPLAAATLEAAYYEVGFALGYWPEGPIRVEMYPKAKLLAVVSSLPEEAVKTTSTIGLCKYNKLMVTSPRGTVRGYGWLDTLAHEYVHLVISQKTENRVPVWLHEGIAKYFERRWRGEQVSPLEPSREDLLAERIEANNLVPLAKMSPSIALLPTQEDASVSYAEVYTVIEFLVQRRGPQAVQLLLDAIAGGSTTEQAFSELVGESWPAFERRWMRWLRDTRPTQRMPVKFDDRVMLLDEQSGKDGEFAGVASPAARDHLQLGELLRARELSAAALQEYRRAEAILGPVHPMVQNGAARVLLEQGEAEAALEALQNATRWFPSYYVSYLNRAAAYNQLGRFEEALVAVGEALGINPFDPRVHEEHVRALEGLGQQDALDIARQNLQQLQY